MLSSPRLGLFALALTALIAMFALLPGAAAATPAGQVYGAGFNEYGELGNGETATSFAYQPIAGLSSVVAVSPNYYSSLALLSNGTVASFGYNDSGELGDGTTEQHLTPQQVPGLSNVTAVAAGAYSAFALLSDGTVKAWGYNAYGELGDGEISTTGCYCVASPVTVKGVGGAGALTHVVAISAGYEDAMALLSNGTVVDWGYNSVGELGDGGTTQSDVPVQVKGVGGIGTLSNVVAISAGLYDNLALLADGSVVAWGYGTYGELGDGETAESDVPVQVKGVAGSGALSNVTAISAGGYFNLALRSNGTVDGWGFDEHYELGNGATAQENVPIEVPGLSGVRAISAGYSFARALLSDGSLYGWGNGAYGEWGDGLAVSIHQPRRVSVGIPGGIFALSHGTYNYQSFILQGATASSSTNGLAFGGQTIGTQSVGRSVVIRNEGPAPLLVSGSALSGSGEFAVSGGTCAGATLAVGATCTLTVTFSPASTGEVKGSLSVSSTSVNTLPVISLTGTGVTSATRPTLSSLRLSRRAFRAATHGPSIVNVPAPGTVVSYTDSQVGITKFTVQAAVGGVLTGKGRARHCDARARRSGHGAKRCVVFKTVGTFAHVDRIGTNRFRFTGSVRKRGLAPGSYRLVAMAASPNGRSAVRTVSFTIV